MKSLRQVLNSCRFAQAPDLDALDTEALTDIQWRADRCTPSSILCFQRFDDGKSDAEIIERYLAHCPFGALVINRALDGSHDHDHGHEGQGQDRYLEQEQSLISEQKDESSQTQSCQPGSCQPGSWQWPTGFLAGRPVFVTAPDAWGETLERLCDHFYPQGPQQWQIAGVTGTNGKTTTLKYLESMLLAEGRRVLSIGTLGLSLNGQPLAETGFTSPPYIELRRILDHYRDRAETLVMEVSSHALHQGRVHGLRFAAAAWTNFSQDHLDYHGDEASYFAAKALILEQLGEGVPLLTTSASVERQLRIRHGAEVPVARLEVPGLEVPGLAAATQSEAERASAKRRGLPAEALQARPFLALSHNRANYALACALANRLLGAEPKAPWQALRPVPGRFDCHVYQNRTIVIDFAHTPDALETILGAIRGAFPAAGLITLFGCGGDRDRSKRPLMGAAVCRGSDDVILTSDNPRFEDPRAIAEDTLQGMAGCSTAPTLILDRTEAIARLFDRLAAYPADQAWVALIAGKGHEPYIDQAGVKRPYNDREQVLRNLKRLGWDAQ
ncbi:MAG: UDP-N-acetylmuramoyl-L-alanyl-D-glutamate--2,6-diaminopimelate ligase [Lamprobacter sp.]|uniref:Mur ligase family protein n=1 Tax=Lamprobacter sp. TaxID=3100796 RepID=UPI002B261704|nr:UDP-N-acetylmuramoyl-L-alanyl-D-glutamate--2,6-diaminopimelate ligase [Lamprobacter sp.]MEA3641526.1 UDP-N-acetylmuramoyl-L-alanyl-D-glutamate--2,6-diaminopimelate ligase [Lamprobacter sp.]